MSDLDEYDRMTAKIAAQVLVVEEEKATPDTDFQNLSADSLDLIEIAMALEEHFELGNLADDQVMACKQVGDMTNLVREAHRAKGRPQ